MTQPAPRPAQPLLGRAARIAPRIVLPAAIALAVTGNGAAALGVSLAYAVARLVLDLARRADAVSPAAYGAPAPARATLAVEAFIALWITTLLVAPPVAVALGPVALVPVLYRAHKLALAVQASRHPEGDPVRDWYKRGPAA